jgi:hypothetical protein
MFRSPNKVVVFFSQIYATDEERKTKDYIKSSKELF